MRTIMGNIRGSKLFLVLLAGTLTSMLLVSCGGDGGGSAGPFSISGQVTSGGAGVAGVTMTLGGAAAATATTDAGGNYTFSGLANGSYTATPAKPGFTFNPPSSAQTISGANITGVNFTAAAAQAAQLVACPASGTTNVTVQDFTFIPANITVTANTIVKWTNAGPSTHTVTSGSSPNSDGAFNSGNLGTGATVCVQFLATGTYPYFCSIHNFMAGSVLVL